MADVIHKNFEHNALEADIQKLSKEIVDKKELPEHKDLSERDIIKKNSLSDNSASGNSTADG